MKNSKNFIKRIPVFLFAAGMLASISSCKKYLEVEAVSSFGTDYTFNSPINAEKAILGTYAAMVGDQGYGIRLSMYYPYDNDEMMGQGGTPYPDNERRDIAHFNAGPSNTQLYQPFLQLYQGVERANLCIYYIPKMAGYDVDNADGRKLKKLHGEALTLRAQFYLELIRNWGDVPGNFEPAFLRTREELYKPKTDRDSIYERLLDDLLLAETLVPWRTQSSADERISQGAVRGLRARIALYRGGYSLRRGTPAQMLRGSDHLKYYQIAKEETETIMNQTTDHKLNPSFRAVFKDNICAHRIEPNGEVIWEVGMTNGGSSVNGDSKLGYYNGPRYNGFGNSALSILPTYFYSFDSTDLRRDVMCVSYNFNADYTVIGRGLHQMVDGKFRRDWITNPIGINSTAQYFGLNWPLIRLSDVMLMYAEAENELNGPTSSAYEAVNKVRRRGFGKDINTPDAIVDIAAGLGKDDFFKAVINERKLELGGEGIRKYDLIRWNLLETKINEVRATLTDMANANVAPWDGYPKNMYFKKASPTLEWSGSFYAPSANPGGSTHTSVGWLGAGILTTIFDYYAKSFTPNKSELLPIPQAAIDASNNALTQDYGY